MIRIENQRQEPRLRTMGEEAETKSTRVERYTISKRCAACGHEDRVGSIEGNAEAAMAAAKVLDGPGIEGVEIVIRAS